MDPGRFEELYDEYWGYVFAICRVRLGDDEDAADAAMEVFLKKWRAIDTYDPARAQFKTWLARNAHNLCIDIIRRRQTANTHTLGNDETLDDLPDASDADPDIGMLLDSLNPMDRQLLLMHELEGYTWEEIAQRTGLSEWQCRQRVQKAKDTLKRHLGDA